MRILLLTLAVAGAVCAAPPQVLKVEPPNWWADHSINPVRLLVRGTNLHGARVESPWPTGRIATNARGTYLFVDLQIPAGTKPGPVPLRVVTPDGSAAIPFAISPPVERAGRFQGFSADDVMYLIMPDRFANGDPSNDNPARSPGLTDRSRKRYYHGGDLQGVIDKLPYLKELGITAIWLNPVYDNNDKLNTRERYDNEDITDYHGYGAVDFYAVDEHLGDLALFRKLVDEAHRHGIKIIQDQVANHTGPFHPWVTDSPTPTWFNGTEARHLANTWQTWTIMDPNASVQTQRDTLDGWFINILPDLNQEDEECRRYLIQNTLWWLGMTGMDGIRQDTLPYVPRRFWRDWMEAIKREYPSITVVGEMLDGNPALVSFFQGGRAQFDGIDTRIDAMFDFPLFYALRRAFGEGGPLRDVPMVLAHDRLYPEPNKLVTFAGLHDVSRFMNAPHATPESLKLAFTVLLTTRGIPLLYYGDELAMKGGEDPDNRRDFPGGWRGDSRNAFTASGRTADEQGVWSHFQKLARLRAQHEPLRRGAVLNLLTAEQQWVYLRHLGASAVVVAINNAAEPKAVEFALPVGGNLADQLGSGLKLELVDGRARVTLPARSSAVFAQ